MYILSLFFFILEKKRCHVAIDICRSCMIDQFCIPFAPICTERERKKYKIQHGTIKKNKTD